MAALSHTYGPTCILTRKASLPGSTRPEDPPDLKAQFFYSSSLPIDDPLSVVPAPGSSEEKAAKTGQRPFSASDNHALDDAWFALFSKGSPKSMEVPVGISRLHLVKLPALQMIPIYWSLAHDLAAVTRGTWFYKDTMLPVEPAVANQLEMGYMDVKPWLQAWTDHLDGAKEGAAATELNILRKLWPDKRNDEISENTGLEKLTTLDNWQASSNRNIASVGTLGSGLQRAKTANATLVTQAYSDSSIFYKDKYNAYIVSPVLQQFGFFRPLQMIRNGARIGIQVVRGFDWRAWDTLHPSKKTASVVKAEEMSPVAESGDHGQKLICPACRKEQQRPKVTDLVLVIHGIGQKMSERVESFHFTHAINSFRRSVNVEFGNSSIQEILRKDLGGIMILPINWRSNLPFDARNRMSPDDQIGTTDVSEDFDLKDITPDSIPTVRTLVSDILLDIPLYMSSHKPQMIDSVIKEANRIYQIWCRNNPGFHEEGRVHIVGHSLGSALALDVLSKQPTFVPPYDPQRKEVQSEHLDFNTTNLFFIGSPVGIFLLLGGGNLTPRRDRRKAGVDLTDDNDEKITAEQGTYGCLAVDNFYNIMDQNDPVAYCLNPTVDKLYATSLKNFQLPSITPAWLGSISNAVQSISRTPANAIGSAAILLDNLPAAIQSSSSAGTIIEPTREELAEKKFHLLNDNGQVDYLLKPGDGPDIQYINMLWAHTSYWDNLDFVRTLIREVGRKPGKAHALPGMKAVKIAPKAAEAEEAVIDTAGPVLKP